MDLSETNEYLELLVLLAERMEVLAVVAVGFGLFALGLWCYKILAAGRGRIDKA